jgi:hypothetical protein
MWDVKPGFAEGSTPMEHENQFCFMHNPCVTSVNHTDVNTRHMCPFPKKSYDVKSCKIGKYKDHNPLYWGYPKKHLLAHPNKTPRTPVAHSSRGSASPVPYQQTLCHEDSWVIEFVENPNQSIYPNSNNKSQNVVMVAGSCCDWFFTYN